MRSLARILGPLRTVCGCIACHLYVDLEDESVLMLAQEWADEESLAEHLRTDTARVLLSALDCASSPPDVRMDTVCETKGLEFIASCRDPDYRGQ
jgi:quinol monooxygenase YgiN